MPNEPQKDLVAEARALAEYVDGLAAGLQDVKLGRAADSLRQLYDEVERLRGYEAEARSAWAELRRWEDNHDQLCLQREQLYCDIHVENAALRDQLAQVEKERSINLCGDVSHCATCAEAKDFKP